MHILTSQNAASFSTFRLPAQLAQVWIVESLDELVALRFSEQPLVLGEGSNTIFLNDMQRPILRYVAAGVTVAEQDDHVLLHVEAGHNWHQLVQYCVAQGWWGIENLALIPGTVGASPVQNIGAYGTELADVCDYVDFYHWQRGLMRLEKSQCLFGYRDSVFKHALQGQGVIVAVGLRLSTLAQRKLAYRGLDHLPQDASLQQIFDAVLAVRQSKLPDPNQVPNCGSFFKNPVVSAELAAQLKSQYPSLPTFPQLDGHVKLAAAWLIEQVGLKGQSAGGVGCYHLQPLVLVNLGNGSAQALQHWVQLIIAKVQQHFAVTLEPEVRMYHGG